MDGRADAEIVSLCRRRRPEGFVRLLLTYQEPVYRRAYRFLHNREDALDITQEVFLRAIPALDRFDPDRPLWPWLRRITTNLCLNHLRSRRPVDSLDGEWDPDEGSPLARLAGSDDTAAAAEARLGREAVMEALADLPPLHRMVVILRHQDGLTYPEIARELGLPLGTVKTYLFRARRALRERLAATWGV